MGLVGHTHAPVSSCADPVFVLSCRRELLTSQTVSRFTAQHILFHFAFRREIQVFMPRSSTDGRSSVSLGRLAVALIAHLLLSGVAQAGIVNLIAQDQFVDAGCPVGMADPHPETLCS